MQIACITVFSCILFGASKWLRKGMLLYPFIHGVLNKVFLGNSFAQF